ncbi:unnamed protein product [Heterobilharzia americana]|nr:unnamed protein product [Heterobilharzia americana]
MKPIGSSESQIAVKSYQHENICSRKKLHWSNLVDDYYNEIIGTYYTDRLANLEYSHLNKVNHYWLNQVGHIHSNNYPVCLSDIIRGPALEATTWPSIKSAIRLRPSKGDMLLTEDPTTGTSNWLINPYVTDYLVGSASLAAFSAYLILQQTNLATSSSSRLISMGSVYNKHSENATSSSDGHQLHSDLKSPFQQSKQISIMELSRNWNRCEAGFHVLTEQLCKFWQIYQPEWSFKLTYSQAANLYPCEMLRAVVQTDMKSSSGVQASIPLASVSLLGDWISRRIMTKTIKKSKTDSDCDPYPYMVFVNAWNFYSLLESLKLIGYIQEHESPTINS